MKETRILLAVFLIYVNETFSTRVLPQKSIDGIHFKGKNH